MELEGFDYLICLSIENTEEDVQNSPHRFLYLENSPKDCSLLKEEGDSFPSIIKFDWCAYNLSTQLVTEEQNAFVKPSKTEKIALGVLKRTGFNITDIESALPLTEILKNVYCFL